MAENEKKKAQKWTIFKLPRTLQKWPPPSEFFSIGLFWYFLVLILAAPKLKMLLASYDQHLLSRGHANRDTLLTVNL